MTMRLSEQEVRKIDAFWANELGCLPEDFHDVGVGVTERQVTDDLYVHVFYRLERLQVDCSPSLHKDNRVCSKQDSKALLSAPLLIPSMRHASWCTKQIPIKLAGAADDTRR